MRKRGNTYLDAMFSCTRPDVAALPGFEMKMRDNVRVDIYEASSEASDRAQQKVVMDVLARK